jgi:non-specific serine/threonine protein kinase
LSSLTNLPQQLTSFIGREREVGEVRRLLSLSRLLTLTGPGGCGKTRLAIEVAGSWVAPDPASPDEFPDGVWLVELAPLSDPALVLQALAMALSVRDTPDLPLLDTLIAYLQARQLLLVLDNCEHLIETCASLVEALLRSCTLLCVLATSREALSIPGETTFVVPSLSLPDTQHLPRAGKLPEYEAIQLFVERSRAAQPNFMLTEENAAAVAQICTRLDGIPLAIELAAARVKLLSVEQIAARLDDRFRLLTGGSRTALPRHQTLGATIEWSHDLLSEKERVLFRRLAVFAGGFTLEAVESICAGDGLDPYEGLDLLSHLVDKSLVMVLEEKGQGEAHYRLLETVRQYAQDRLLESGEAATLRNRHLDYYLRLAKEAEPRLTSVERSAWLDRLEAEHDNLRAAIQWGLSTSPVTGLELTSALWWFWHYRGYWSEGRQWLERALGQADGRASPRARAKALYGLGALSWLLGDLVSARDILEESTGLSGETGDKPSLAYALTFLGRTVEIIGEVAPARALLEESVAIFREVEPPDRWGLAHALGHLGIVAYRLEDDAAARSFSEESLTLFREAGDRWGIALALHGLGLVANSQREHEHARALFEESLEIGRDLDEKGHMAEMLNWLGETARLQGDYERALSCYAQSRALFTELASWAGKHRVLHNVGYVAYSWGDLSLAIAFFAEAATLAVRSKRLYAHCLASLSTAIGIRDGTQSGQTLRDAAKLIGAGDTMRDLTGDRLDPSDRDPYDRDVHIIRQKLGDEAFLSAWDEGKKMLLSEGGVQTTLALGMELAAPYDELRRVIRSTEDVTGLLQPPGKPTAPPALATRNSEPSSERAGKLTSRERQVIALVARGYTNREIAQELVITERTAEIHMSNILSKLGLSSRAQAAVFAVEQGLTG